MRVGLIGQKWIGEQVLKGVLDVADVAFVAAPAAGDRLAQAASVAGVPTFHYAGRRLADLAFVGRCDLLLTVGSFAFVPSSLRDRADWCIGYHPSLLPLYRGPRAVEDAISAGGRVTGGSVYHLTDDFDAGGIAFQDWCFIRKGETAADLWRRALAPMGVELIAKAVGHLDTYGFLPSREQAAETA